VFKKIYFYDCGIRNAVINNFKSIDSRTDAGALWENYVIAERMKFLHYQNIDAKQYFWRTTQQQEIDLVEIKNKKILAFEFKYGSKKIPKIPIAFSKAYPDANFEVVNDKTYLDFIL
jgi:predicted AAA+ superfamily ATPase